MDEIERFVELLNTVREHIDSPTDSRQWAKRITQDFDEFLTHTAPEKFTQRLEKYAESYDSTTMWTLVSQLKNLADSFLDRDVTNIKGIGESRADKLENLEIDTIHDLLHHFPRAYTDRRFVDDIRDVETDQTVTVLGEVVATGVIRGRKPRFEVRLGDDTGVIRVNFWNQTYLSDQIYQGQQLFCTGTAESYRGSTQINNPDYEIIESEDDLENKKTIQPIYSLTDGVYLTQIQKWIRTALDRYQNVLIDCLPRSVRREEALSSYPRAIRNLHAPESIEQLQTARKRLIFEEFFFYQLVLTRQRWQIDHTPKSREYSQRSWIKKFVAELPFDLTDAQRAVLETLQSDLTSNRPMHRMLQGDVGTGKTVVATASLLRVCENGYQVAIMAPTEVLAEQHYENLSKLLEGLPVDPTLLIGSQTTAEKNRTRENIKTGEAPFLVGTHALIGKSVDFSNLAYVVIDEQHRFGVEQRRQLREQGADVDMLIMSATPIPRSLAMTAYGDLTISTLDEYPTGPKQIETQVLEQTDRDRKAVYTKVRDALDGDERAFFVFPAIEESEDSELMGARESWEKARQSEFFDAVRTGLIHGQMTRERKQTEMQKFRNGEIQLLFSTTVIEVGIDVPEASYLVVHDAERFGLAQLHQLRGRIGRGGQQAYCYLLVDPDTAEDSKQRIDVLEETQDGFEVSRADLKFRGIGDLTGTRQSGRQLFRIGNVWEHSDIMATARERAEEVLEQSDGLEDESFILTKQKLEKEFGAQQKYAEIG